MRKNILPQRARRAQRTQKRKIIYLVLTQEHGHQKIIKEALINYAVRGEPFGSAQESPVES